MAEADAPKWGFGLPPLNINPVDSSFTKFFPTCDSTEKPISNGAYADMSWNATLAVPVSYTRPPAWTRVAIQPQASTTLTRPIMKRVGLCARRSAVNTPITTFVRPSAAPVVREVESRCIRRRLANYEPTQEEAKFAGRPSSQAEVAAQIMQAKVVATNNFIASFFAKPLDDKKQSRKGTYVRFTPVKRYAGSDVAKTDAVGGNTISVYRELGPIIDRAITKGMSRVDYTTASIAETSSIMNDIRRNPRRFVAAHGVPDLSDIADATEPESPHMIRPPTLKAESRSPRKRIARLTSPIKNGFQRITSSIVKLVPGSSPKAEPSPSKSDSTPSTPLKLSPTPTKLAITPAGNSSPLSRSAYVATENVEYSPPRVFRVPSCTDSSSLAQNLSHSSSPSHQDISPAKFSRPVAPTPSRWNRPEPATPQGFTPMPTQWTPGQNDSPIKLSALIPPSTPQAPKCTFNATTPTNAEFRFGEVSAFNSPSWMNSSIEASEPRRIQTTNVARRRQSEPLLRQHFKSQARRRSSSPRKPVLQNDDMFSENTFSIPPLPSARLTAPQTDVPDIVTTVDEDVTMMTVEPTSLYTKPQTEVQDEIENANTHTNLQTPTVAITPAQDTKNALLPTTEHGVLNIDTRLNPDIFGAQGSSSPPAPVQKLAQIADDGCAGHANVVVKHENGRLYVRFKLPLDYAYMFPDSQGFDESRFTTSPSAISSSPRISFATRQSSLKSGPSLQDQSALSPFVPSQRSVQRLPSLLDKSALSPFAARQRSTLRRSSFKDQSICSPFKPSPSIQNESAWSPSSMPSPENQSVWSPYWGRAENTPGGSADCDRTLVVDWPLDGEASTQKTPSKRRASMMSALENTPSMMGQGLAEHATPSVQTPAFQTPELPASTPLFANLTASAKPTSPLEPTPTTERARATPSKSPVASTPTPAVAASVASITPIPAHDTMSSGPQTHGTPTVAPTPTNSFTPVNKTTPRVQVTAPSVTTSVTPENTTPAKVTPVAKSPAPPPSARQETFDDSPGRDYMRDFIKRSRQATTTETGSPIAPPAKRQPLVAKSPNSGSAQKKRKLEKDDDNSSPLKQQEATEKSKEPKEPVAKRARRTIKSTKSTKQKASPTKEIVHDTPAVLETAAEQTEEANDQDELAHEGPATRRSTRLQTVASLGPKSSIPTAIKLNHRSGAGRGGAVLNSTVRSEQQELTAQTRLNTKKNKGAAEYPAQVLARVAEAMQSEDSDNSSDAPSNSSKGRKTVVWNEPLEQVPEKPKKGRSAAKAKATQGKTGIAKPKTTAQTKRTTKLAENLGMVSNGTPARPTRMTRSRTRSQA
ncbi:hypothetical protein EDB81DRAFT_459374 [Dactylonectria macrodidyma]|uniref:Uncharacterized protein n=1 Tax=Dactylonectria macrodidyma TaxID=307937 RepID=A0A9P9EZ98_9HYPO|nr:hypothetical protein EDB81DRAFT_459374 [Dactylonectria macrodidyma]